MRVLRPYLYLYPPFQAHGMQLGSGLVSAPIAGPIPRDERALRHRSC
jgi:hypothetical protein